MHQAKIIHGNINANSIYINNDLDIKIVKLGFGFT